MEIIENLPENLIDFLVFPPDSDWLLMVKIIFIVFSSILIAFIIFALLETSWLKLRFLYDFVEFLTFRPFGAKKIEKDWRKIKARMGTGLESEYKLAIIEADNMLDEILKQLRHEGEGLEKKLEKITAATLSNVEEIKEAHQIRNNIIYDPNYKLSLDETKRILEVFEKALKSLDVF